jgi:hypothetical protein
MESMYIVPTENSGEHIAIKEVNNKVILNDLCVFAKVVFIMI